MCCDISAGLIANDLKADAVRLLRRNAKSNGVSDCARCQEGDAHEFWKVLRREFLIGCRRLRLSFWMSQRNGMRTVTVSKVRPTSTSAIVSASPRRPTMPRRQPSRT